jgi:galactokinase
MTEARDRERTGVASAPGRVNLMGEHTDYNQGLVLPMPIPQQTKVELRQRADDRVLVTSAAFERTASYRLGSEQRRKEWIDYIQAVTDILRRHSHLLTGFEARISSDVPLGAGLSSSASLTVALLRVLRAVFALSIDDYELARLARAAEVEFVGVPIGMMDPLVVSLGQAGGALFIDTRASTVTPVAIPAEIEVVVIDSGVKHALDSGEYRTRRDECARAAQQLCVSSLREFAPEHEARLCELEPRLQRRVRHILSENERVVRTLQALRQRDCSQLGLLFMQSHISMRDDYEVSTPEIDQLVEIAFEQPGILGARLTGGGFGGSVVMLADRGQGLRAAHDIAAEYAHASGMRPRVLLPREEALVDEAPDRST